MEADQSGSDSWKSDHNVELLKQGALRVIPTDAVYLLYFFLNSRLFYCSYVVPFSIDLVNQFHLFFVFWACITHLNTFALDLFEFLSVGKLYHRYA